MSAVISAEGIPRRILGAWQAGFFGMYVSYDLERYELTPGDDVRKPVFRRL